MAPASGEFCLQSVALPMASQPQLTVTVDGHEAGTAVPTHSLSGASMDKDAPGWKELIFQRLRKRNLSQRHSFEGIFNSYTSLLESSQRQRERLYHLDVQRRGSSRDLSGERSTTPDASDADSVAVRELEERVNLLQKELSDAYKAKLDNTEALLRYKEQADVHERELLKKEKELEDAVSALARAEQTVEQEQSVGAKLRASIEVLQLEVKSLREQLQSCDAQIKELSTDNRRLIEQLLNVQNARAEEMNEMNDQYEKLLAEARQKEELLKRQSMESSSEQKIAAVDLSDKHSILDSAAWQSNFNVTVPAKSPRFISAHDGQCTCLTYSANGLLIMSGGTDQRVHIWDARSGSSRGTLRGATQSVMAVALSNDEQYAIAGGNDKTARVYSMQTSRVRHTLTGHTAKIYAVAFSADTSRAISGSHDRSIRVWDMDNGYSVKTILCSSSCNALSLSPNGDLLASAHLDKAVRFFSLRSGETMCELKGLHTQQATCTEFSRDGTTVLTNSRDSTLCLVDVRNFQTVKVFKDPKGQFKTSVNWARATFSPDAKFVAAGSADGNVYVWDVATAKVHSILKHTWPSKGQPQGVSEVAWNRNGSQLVSADNVGRIIIWE